MVWKFCGDRPIYQQIVAQIQCAILVGEFPPGSRLPSVRDLASAARVNPNTMQHALQELESSGLISTQGTNGKFVTDDEQIIDQTRQKQIHSLVKESIARFAEFGISPLQAGQYLTQYSKERMS